MNLALHRSLGGTALALVCAAAAQAQAPWTHSAGVSHGVALRTTPAPSLASPRWTRTTDAAGVPLNFLGQTSLAVDETRVYAVARISPPGEPANQHRLYAFRATDGAVLWWASIDAPSLESSSGPVVSPEHDLVLIASGTRLLAFDGALGTLRAVSGLPGLVVNASPIVTDDLGNRDRAFITTYDGFGADGQLLCINLDPFDAEFNPYTLGQVVWSATIGGSSGNTPAYIPARLGGRGFVYVASIGEFGVSPPRILAYPADLALAQPLEWSVEFPGEDGFFGGVALRPARFPGDSPTLFAATYRFTGGIQSSTLVAVDAVTGSIRWTAPANRTRSTPVPLPDGRVLLSGGIDGFGTVPSLRLYQDLGSSATLLFDSALDTFVDADGDFALDPGEFLRLGGWTLQPAVALRGSRAQALIGVPSTTGTFAASPLLYLVDLNQHPSSPAFIRASFPGAGGSAALGDLAAFSVGTTGLHAFGAPGATLDLDADNRITLDDLYAFDAVPGDCDQDGTITPADRALLVTHLRDAERQDLITTRRP